jgi:antitoxin CptB
MTNDTPIYNTPAEEIPRLKWLCRRGVKELDIIMSHYLEYSFLDAPVSEQKAFRELLQIEDPTLFQLVVGSEKSPDAEQDKLLAQLRTAIFDRNKKHS